MATTSTPSLNRTTSAEPQGAEGDHSPGQAEQAVELRPDQSTLAASHGYGESPETDSIQTSDNDQLEKEIRSLKQQLNRFYEINPEEYTLFRLCS
jgi:hypothetical protein